MTILFTHPDCLQHNPGEGHPERPARLSAILKALDTPEFVALDRRSAPLAERADIERVHPVAFVETILESAPTRGHTWIDGDTAMSPGSDQAALRAAGSLVAAVDAVCGGEAKTEEIVRGWVANQPIMINGDTKILEALAARQCDVGITNTYYLGHMLAKDPNASVAAFWANQGTTGTHVNVSGAGVTAASKNRANAVKLLEFLTSPEAQQMFADSNYEFPANPHAGVNAVIAKWGKFKQDDINVAAAGQYQAAAIKLADRANYK